MAQQPDRVGLVVWVGVVLFGADYGLIYWSERSLDSGLTAILFATLPLVTSAMAHVYLPDDRMTGRKLAGTLLAFVGVAALFGDRIRLERSQIGPMAAVVASAVSLGGAVALLLASLATGERLQLPGDAGTWAAVGYLAVVGSVVSFLAYFSLLRSWSVTSLSFISVFTPIIALALGFAVLDERPTIWTAAGAALILAGTTLAISRRSAT